MWARCYNVCAFDLQKVSDEIQDNILKSFQLTFTIDTLAAVSYDFLMIITYQSELYVDRITGEVTTS